MKQVTREGNRINLIDFNEVSSLVFIIMYCFIDLLTVEAADGNIYSAQALLTAVVASCLVTLMVGFVIGYLFSRRFRHPFFTDTSPFNEQHNHLNRYFSEYSISKLN